MHSEMGPVRQNPMQRTVRSVHTCVCIALCTILHSADLVIFTLTLQTITIAKLWRITDCETDNVTFNEL